MQSVPEDKLELQPGMYMYNAANHQSHRNTPRSHLSKVPGCLCMHRVILSTEAEALQLFFTLVLQIQSRWPAAHAAAVLAFLHLKTAVTDLV